MSDIYIESPGAQFRSTFLLYIVEVRHEQERYLLMSIHSWSSMRYDIEDRCSYLTTSSAKDVG